MVRIGLIELAFGAVFGWPVVASLMRPKLLEHLGVREPRRILQAHLDYVIMGLILVAVGLAVPGLPGWLAGVLVFGTWVNPTLFLPLAFRPAVVGALWYQVLSALSFVATSGGLVGAAIMA